jgi:V/A-type H+-transporting ATPase subunit K
MKKIVTILSVLVPFLLVAMGIAQDDHSAVAAGRTIGDGLIAIGAGLAIGIGAIGVGIAQAAIGSAGAGTLAERPQAFGQILIYLVIPETLIIFAFVIAFFLNGQIN